MKIKNFKEKRLIMARFLVCDKAELNKKRVWEMWNNYWKKDFKIPGHKEMLVLDNDKLTYRKITHNENYGLLKEYNDTFNGIYNWLVRILDKHDRVYIEEQIKRQRTRQKNALINKSRGYHVVEYDKPFNSKELTQYRLEKYRVRKKITKDGTYESLLEFLNQSDKN